MRRRLPLSCACLLACACASRPAGLPVPPSRLPLADEPPPLPRPPREGPYDSADARLLVLEVEAGGRVVELRGWCRVGVWTTLQQLQSRAFVTRESWGRLGDRPPKLLARIEDEVLGGVVARLRPEEDGSVSFQVEVAEARVDSGETVDIYHGRRIVLRRPRRNGYRFRGRARGGGLVAAWGDGVRVALPKESGEPAVLRRFAAGEAAVVVAGPGAAAETFVEEWRPADPIHIVAEGVERKDFRLERRRRAAGFEPDGQGGHRTYGADFEERE